MKTKQPVHIMGFEVAVINIDLFPPFFFPHTEAKIKCLEKLMQSLIKRVGDGRSYVWQQNSVPSHTNGRTQCWLSENFCDHITSKISRSNSPDCNPLNYYVREDSCANDLQNTEQHQRLTECKYNGIIYQFKHGDYPKGFHEILKSSRGL